MVKEYFAVSRSLMTLLPGLVLSLYVSAQTGPGSFLPEKENLPGWRANGETSIIRNDGLRKVAGEETPLILEYGFNYLALQSYYNFSGGKIKVEVYAMDNSFGSCGLFLRHSRKEKTFSEYGNKCYEKKGEFGFWKQYYFIRMSSSSANDSIMQGYRQIAAYIDSKIRSKGLLPGILNQSGNNLENVRIFNGPMGLSEIYYFGPQNIFFIDEGLAYEKGDTTKIILRYSDKDIAMKRFTDTAGILGSMDKFSGFRMEDDFSFSMNDREGKKLLIRVDDKILMISIKN